MAREVLLFLILFAAGMMILAFAGVVWMTAIWEKLALTLRQNAAKMRQNALQVGAGWSRGTLSKREVRFR